MKKMKKFIAALASGLMMAMPILGMPVFAQAATVDDEVYLDIEIDDPEYEYYDYCTEYSVSTDLDYIEFDAYGETMDDVYMNLYFSTVDQSKAENFTVSITLPLYVTKFDFTDYYYDNSNNYCGTITSWSFNGRTITVTGTTSDEGYFDVEFDGAFSFTPSEEDQFWFIPMKTQLNIAAEIASTSGKEAVAEVSGDFALSYEIMKWLEDHPNVTLKYNLTYKEKDYNIVIKGGQKLANPEIPWYGPEYLIGKFAK